MRRIRRELREAHDPVRAENEKRYMKSEHKFLGVNIPTLRKMARELVRELAPASRREVFGLASALWASKYHQEKTLAIFLLAAHPEFLDMKAMPVIEKMLSESTGWDHTDYISTSLAGRVLEKDPRAYVYLKRWEGSGSLWVRRASLISQLPLLRKGEGDREFFFRLAASMAGEKDFFIRKAIGWTVREMAKTDPEAAFGFLMTIRDRASGLTLREGAKRLPESMKREVLA